MRPHRASLRSLVLLIPLAAGSTGFAGGGRQTGCSTAISGWLSCQTNGFNAYFSSGAAGTISGDTVWLNTGSVYLSPSQGGQGASRSRRAYGTAGSAIVVKTNYTTASGPSQDSTALVRPQHGTTTDAAANPAWFLVSNPGNSTTVVALVKGNLTTPSTLNPGCQTATPGSTTAITSTTQAALDSIATHFSLTIHVPNNGNC
jgi:hypothetical protein